MSLERPQDQDIVIVGATGDLASRKLLPALFNLQLAALLPEKGRIVGCGRTAMTDEEFRNLAKSALQEFSRSRPSPAQWSAFAERLSYCDTASNGFEGLASRLTQSNRLIYLAIPPSAFATTVRAIGSAALVDGTRVIIEKPFGHDLASSQELTRSIHAVFDETQVFRIDHFLGKETVQNILVFRFGNAIFERIWNRDSIEHVQFTVAESIGIEERGAFYEETGALRDILQNHVFQVLSLLTMEAPASLHCEAVRDEKSKLFEAMRPLTPEDLVRGQYARSVIDGKTVKGYSEEDGVAADSDVETYAAVRLFIDNWRWGGVPFYLRTGKRLPRRATEVTVVFRPAPIHLFSGSGGDGLKPNVLNLCIQPDETISLQFLAKAPGPEIEVQPVDMQFSYEKSFTATADEAYERLIHDAMDGDNTLFARADAVDRAWSVVGPVLQDLRPVEFYRAGTWGPEAANKLIGPHLWHLR